MNEILIIIALILLNGIFAMSEIALISVRKSYLIGKAKDGNRSARVAMKLIENPDKFLSIIQIGITVIGILTGIYSGSVLADDFSIVLEGWGVSVAYSHLLAQSVIVVFVTYLTLIFGELVPKRIGLSAAEKTALLVARPMRLLAVVASPFVTIMTKSTSSVFNMLGLDTSSGKITEEEIKSMINEGTKDGEVQEVEQDILERVFLLGDLKVSSIMCHRSEVVSLDINMNNSEIKEVLTRELYDTYPVIDKTFDNVRGVVSLKDLIFKLDDENFCLSSVVSVPVYFHENVNVYKVLEQMKEFKAGYALICDEFGSCQGIITLKDILEGLVGSMDDVYSEPQIIKRSDGVSWLVDGQCPFYDLLSYLDKESLYSNDSDYNTVGGLVLEYLEHIPHSGESIIWNEFKFEVVDMDGVRIDKILVTLQL